MKAIDLIFLAAIAGVTALTYQYGWYSTSIFSGGLFFIFLSAVYIHYNNSPLPRYIIGAKLLAEGELKESGEPAEEK